MGQHRHGFLQNPLGGNARCTVLATVGSAAEKRGQTRRSLEFASQAKEIQTIVSMEATGPKRVLQTRPDEAHMHMYIVTSCCLQPVWYQYSFEAQM